MYRGCCIRDDMITNLTGVDASGSINILRHRLMVGVLDGCTVLSRYYPTEVEI